MWHESFHITNKCLPLQFQSCLEVHMPSGIIVPLREIGIWPGGYGMHSPISKVLWDEEDILLVSCPENNASFSVHLVILYLETPDHHLRLWCSGSQSRIVTAPGEHLPVSGDMFGGHNRDSDPVSSQPGARILPSILWCTGQVSTTKHFPPNVPVVSRLRTPALIFVTLYCNPSLTYVSPLPACKIFIGQRLVFCLRKCPPCDRRHSNIECWMTQMEACLWLLRVDFFSPCSLVRFGNYCLNICADIWHTKIAQS